MLTTIYCDIDGVLHPWPSPPDRMFAAGCVARLAGALVPYDIAIVITSTWRLEWPIERIREKMGVLGKYLAGVTPDIDDPFIKFSRYHEVLQHRQQNALTNSHWIAIDDEPGRYPDGLESLILTNPRTGFAADDAVVLARLLARNQRYR